MFCDPQVLDARGSRRTRDSVRASRRCRRALWILPFVCRALLAGQYPAVVDLRQIEFGAGSEIQGSSSFEETAHSLSGGGDLNGDGAPDLAIGAHEASHSGFLLAGIVYVVFGGSGIDLQFELDALDGTNGFTIFGLASFDTLGKAVSLRGDLNDDGLDDLVIGAPFADPNGIDGAGSAYVIFGSTDPFPVSFDLAALDGTNGFAIHGASVLDLLGSAVDVGPDLDNDGVDDLALGAPGTNDPVHGGLNSGETYVVYGDTDFPPAFLIADHLPESGGDGSQVAVLRNGETGAEVGMSAAISEDLNADGLADLIVGAWLADPLGRVDAGAVYVVFGRDDRPATIALDLLDGSDGFVLQGASAGDEAGYTAGQGDVDTDGVPDILVGAPMADPGGLSQAGEAYIVFGGLSTAPAAIDLAALTLPTGVRIPGVSPGDENGWSVSGASDVNGDGSPDLVLGARSVGFESEGNAYLVYGQAIWPEVFDLTTLDGVTGTRFDGSGQTGFSLTAYADLNGDSTADLVIGDPKADPNGNVNAGIAYLVYGPALRLTLSGTCPDGVEVRVRHATPSTRIELYWAPDLGSGSVPEGDCLGTPLDLDSPRRIGGADTTAGGSFDLERPVEVSFCGVYLQVVDQSSCETTSAIALPLSAPAAVAQDPSAP